MIKEQKDYYPFGKEHENSDLITSTNRYTFSGKEKQIVGNVNFLDFSNRMYDDFICRWTTQDPLQEKRPWISSYVFCSNNPVGRTDPNGLLDGNYFTVTGSWIATDMLKDTKQYVVLDQKEADFLSKVGVTTPDFTRSAVEIPSQQVMNMGDEAFKKTSDIEKEYEYGFVVATDGTTSSMLTNENGNSVQLGTGYVELESQGKQTSFDVHTHPVGFTPIGQTQYEVGDPNPSGTPGITGTGDYRYRQAKEANRQVSQPSWVLGFNTTATSANGILAPNSTPVLTTYNSSGVKYQTNWNTFKNIVNTVKTIMNIK
jgi:RHS repeat-associated protein